MFGRPASRTGLAQTGAAACDGSRWATDEGLTASAETEPRRPPKRGHAFELSNWLVGQAGPERRAGQPKRRDRRDHAGDVTVSTDGRTGTRSAARCVTGVLAEATGGPCCGFRQRTPATGRSRRPARTPCPMRPRGRHGPAGTVDAGYRSEHDDPGRQHTQPGADRRGPLPPVAKRPESRWARTDGEMIPAADHPARAALGAGTGRCDADRGICMDRLCWRCPGPA